MPPVYIITPTYNSANYVSYVIKSVIKQAKFSSIVYHIQDGGSTDGTIAIIEGWKQRFDRHYPNIAFSYDSSPDKGIYDAITKSVEKLNIPEDAFMGWINSDDLLCDNCLFYLKKATEELPEFDWFGGYCHIEDMTGNVLTSPEFQIIYPRSILRSGLCHGNRWFFIQQEGTFWKKSLWDRVGGLNLEFSLAGDWDLWRRMSLYSEYVSLPAYMGTFRIRDGQLSAGSKYFNEIDNTISPLKRTLSSLKIALNLDDMSYIKVTLDEEGKFKANKSNYKFSNFKEKFKFVTLIKHNPLKKLLKRLKKIKNVNPQIS